MLSFKQLIPLLTIFAAGGALVRNLWYSGGGYSSYNSYNNMSFETAATAAASNNCQDNPSSTAASSLPPSPPLPPLPLPHLCHENPYAASLLEGHSLETVQTQVNTWLANKTAIRNAMYWKSYGTKPAHDKFDAFQVMAPCHYTCAGGACRDDTSKLVCGTDTLRLLQPDCIVYSIGGNNNWDFERDIYRKHPVIYIPLIVPATGNDFNRHPNWQIDTSFITFVWPLLTNLPLLC
jgi:hypothetical protein